MLVDSAYPWKRKVKGKYQCFLIRSPMKNLPPGAYRLIGGKIDGCMPVELFQMDGMKRRIGDAQQQLSVRRDFQCHVSRSVAGGGKAGGVYVRVPSLTAVHSNRPILK